MTGFILKIIATVAMVLAYLACANQNLVIPLFYIGKIALPLFAFLIVEGYVHTRSFKKYLTRILVFAIIAQYPFYKFLTAYNPDVDFFVFDTLFTFAVGLIALKILDTIKGKFKKKIPGIIFGIIPGIVLAIAAEFLNFDNGLLTISLLLIFYLLRKYKSVLVWVYSIFIAGYVSRSLLVNGGSIKLDVNSIRHVLFQLLAYELALGLITLYNNKRGKDGKYVRLTFYFFYPIQFIFMMLYMAILK